MKEKLIKLTSGFKSIQPNSKRFDEVRDDLLNFKYETLHETIWNILNDFPEHHCLICKSQTKFKSYQFGYNKYCDVTCSNRFKAKNDEFKEKISKSLKKFNSEQTILYYNNRAEKARETIKHQSDEYKLKKKNKKSETTKAVHYSRSKEEKEVYNNKISLALKNSEKAKTQRIARAKLGAQALKDYKSKLSKEELKEFNLKYGNKDIDLNNRDNFKKYSKLVWYYTNKELDKLINIEMRSTEFHLDHKYSIKTGFLNGISPEIIGNNINLEIIHYSINCSKGSNCSISKEELLSSFENLKIGDF